MKTVRSSHPLLNSLALLTALSALLIWRIAGFAADPSEATGWAVGSAGTILHWDGRCRWEKQDSKTTLQLRSISAVDDTHAWVVGGDGVNGAIILSTDDGGKNWKEQKPKGNFAGPYL